MGAANCKTHIEVKIGRYCSVAKHVDIGSAVDAVKNRIDDGVTPYQPKIYDSKSLKVFSLRNSWMWPWIGAKRRCR